MPKITPFNHTFDWGLFAHHLREVRHERQISLRAAAIDAGVAIKSLHTLEKGNRTSADLMLILRLCDWMHYELSVFLVNERVTA